MVLSFFNYKLFEENGLLGHTKTNILFSPAVSCYSRPSKCAMFPRGLIRLNTVFAHSLKCSCRTAFSVWVVVVSFVFNENNQSH